MLATNTETAAPQSNRDKNVMPLTLENLNCQETKKNSSSFREMGLKQFLFIFNPFSEQLLVGHPIL